MGNYVIGFKFDTVYDVCILRYPTNETYKEGLSHFKYIYSKSSSVERGRKLFSKGGFYASHEDGQVKLINEDVLINDKEASKLALISQSNSELEKSCDQLIPLVFQWNEKTNLFN